MWKEDDDRTLFDPTSPSVLHIRDTVPTPVAHANQLTLSRIITASICKKSHCDPLCGLFLLCLPTALKWPSAVMIAGTVRVKAPTLDDQQPLTTLPHCLPFNHPCVLSFFVFYSAPGPLCPFFYQLSDICSFSTAIRSHFPHNIF